MKFVRSMTSAIAMGALLSTPQVAWGHNFLAESEVPAGYKHDLNLLVTHGCKGSPVKEVRVKIPPEVEGARVHNNHDWDIETIYRPLDEPRRGEGGIMITEVLDQIIWKNPKRPMPDNMYEAFRFRITVPKEPNKILFFKSINVCEDGQDAYIDMPEEELDLADPQIKEKMWTFLTATATPSTFVITRPVAKKQYPWEWEPDEMVWDIPEGYGEESAANAAQTDPAVVGTSQTASE